MDNTDFIDFSHSQVVLASPAYFDDEEAWLRSLALASQQQPRRPGFPGVETGELYEELENEMPEEPPKSKTLRGQRFFGIIPGLINAGMKFFGSMFNPQPGGTQPVQCDNSRFFCPGQGGGGGQTQPGGQGGGGGGFLFG